MRLGQIDVAALRGLVATAEENHGGFAISPEIDAIAPSFVYSQLEDALAYGFPVAGQPEPQAVDLDQDPRPGSFVLELRNPPVERNHPVRAAVLANLGHRQSVAFRLQSIQVTREAVVAFRGGAGVPAPSWMPLYAAQCGSLQSKDT